MNILIYIPDLTQANGGIRQYAIGLLNTFSSDESNIYFIYHNNGDKVIIDLISKYSQYIHVSDSDINAYKKGSKKYSIKSIKKYIANKIGVFLSTKHKSDIDILCEIFLIDILHSPYQFIPQAKNVKLITTLHDVQEIHHPEYFTANERAYRATAYLDYLNRSDKVIVSYEHIKKDLIKYFNIPSEKVQVILLNMNNIWLNQYTETDIIDLTNFSVPEIFLLYPANTWEHKNHIRLLRAVAFIREIHGININIICTGFLNKHFETINNLSIELQLQNQVLFLGVVEERVLYSLYKTCRGVVIPTTYEAGSFPLYESIILNTPVICSNVTSLPETIGKDDYTFNPYEIEEMARKIFTLWTDDKFIRDNKQNLQERLVFLENNNALYLLKKTFHDLVINKTI